tara:strand:- start:306 stop:407 length:102 start_codon:yes stop_codon:yes gene_type:complete
MGSAQKAQQIAIAIPVPTTTFLAEFVSIIKAGQ